MLNMVSRIAGLRFLKLTHRYKDAAGLRIFAGLSHGRSVLLS